MLQAQGGRRSDTRSRSIPARHARRASQSATQVSRSARPRLRPALTVSAWEPPRRSRRSLRIPYLHIHGHRLRVDSRQQRSLDDRHLRRQRHRKRESGLHHSQQPNQAPAKRLHRRGRIYGDCPGRPGGPGQSRSGDPARSASPRPWSSVTSRGTGKFRGMRKCHEPLPEEGSGAGGSRPEGRHGPGLTARLPAVRGQPAAGSYAATRRPPQHVADGLPHVVPVLAQRSGLRSLRGEPYTFRPRNCEHLLHAVDVVAVADHDHGMEAHAAA